MSMVNKVVAEAVGTFAFLGVILATGEAIPIAVALAAVIFLFGKVSGGNFNPAVSAMLFAKGDMKASQFGAYVVAQVVGGLLALAWHKRVNRK
jgi:glycerol uptake facilitator-like aquaporin